MKHLRRQLSYSNAVATIALFIALGGVSYAALRIPRNSVGTTQLRNQSVSTAKVKDEAITGPKIDLSSLGAVSNANHATTAGSAIHANSADTAGRAEVADSAIQASNANTLEGQRANAFGTVFVAHIEIGATATEVRHWGSVTGIAPTSLSSADVEMITPYHSNFSASDFTVYSPEGSGETGHVDVRLYVNGQATELSCFVPEFSPCINPPGTRAHIPGGSTLAVSVHEEPEGTEIPAFHLEVSFQLSPNLK